MERTAQRPRVESRPRPRDLRDWISQVERMGQLKVITGAHWNLEIGTITELNAQRRDGPAVLFDEIVDYPKGYRILSGTVLNAARMALTLNLPTKLTDRELVEALRGKPHYWENLAAAFPYEEVAEGPVLEEVKRGEVINLWEFPSPFWHEEDGGRFLGTGCCVITRDPDTGIVNLGTYRVMVHDERTLGLMISPGKHGRVHMQKWHERGQAMPVAVSFGQDVLLWMMSSLEVPLGICEYNYIGAVRGQPVQVIKGPVTGLPIPADAEVVIEGFVPPDERWDEGPFGEWAGYYASGKRPEPVIRVEALYHRKNPIILASPPGRPPYDHSYMRTVIRSAMIKDALERAGVPEIQGVWAPESGGSRLLVIVSIKQRYAGHARQAGFVASQCREGAYAGRYVIVVDEDIDPTNINDVLWALCTRSDPAQDIDIIRRAWSTALDPMVRHGAEGMFNSRAIIDACRPFEWMREFPHVSESSPELKAKIQEKWRDVIGL